MSATRARAVAAALLVAAVALSCRRCACAPLKPRLTREIMEELMSRDQLYADVLGEHVLLRHGDVPGVPAWAMDELLPSTALHDGVDPLATLLQATVSDYQSSIDLTVAAAVLAAAIRCVAYKRVAVHVALGARMLALKADDAEAAARATVLAHVLPLTVDMLTAAGAPHAELLDLADLIAKHAHKPDGGGLDRNGLTQALDKSATALNAAVRDTCKVADMAEYVRDLGLTGGGEPAPAITGDQRVADAVPLDEVVRLMRANENAMMDVHERLYMLRAVDMSVWATVIDFPELPGGNAKLFERTPAVEAGDAVVAQLNRTDRAAALAHRMAERKAAIERAAENVPYELRPIPIILN